MLSQGQNFKAKVSFSKIRKKIGAKSSLNENVSLIFTIAEAILHNSKISNLPQYRPNLSKSTLKMDSNSLCFI